MQNVDKAKVICIGIAGLLLLILVIIMICGGCSDRSNPDWNFQWNAQSTQGSTTTGGTTTGDTANATSGDTTGGKDVTIDSSENGTTGSQENQGITDREEINNPTQPSKPTPTTTPTTPPTNPTESTGETTDATTEGTTEATTPDTDGKRLITWEEWKAMDTEQKKAYRDSFPIEGVSYAQWYTDAYEAWRKENIIITDGNIDLGGGN